MESRNRGLAALLDRLSHAPRRQLAFATLLTGLAGFVDAVGYVQLGHFYLSFMSGNSTHLGMSLAVSGWADAVTAGAIILAFVMGAFLGTLLYDKGGLLRVIVVLAAELAIFLIAIALATRGSVGAALIPVAAAMGTQNVLRQIIAGADVGKGFISGSLFGLGQSLAGLVQGKSRGRQAVANGLSWVAFVMGVVLGTSVFAAIGLPASLALVSVVITLMIAAVSAGWL
ncbi:YoaK family protein [Paenirhodobacter populi]|uniref:YoaK family protein n=1 Tax=Paenirhodobacter populi TaxID=2306993 RepID=UPI0013E37588|nr:YoaK family protein [Sinirhodobacter populi]